MLRELMIEFKKTTLRSLALSISVLVTFFSSYTLLAVELEVSFETGFYSTVDPGIENRYAEKGFTLSAPSQLDNHFDSGPIGGLHLSTPFLVFHELGSNSVNNVVTLSFGGQLFDLVSFDLILDSLAQPDAANPAMLVSASDGRSLITVDGFQGTLLPDWKDITWVTFDIISSNFQSGNVALDNLVLDNHLEIEVGLPVKQHVAFANPASNVTQQTFLRFINIQEEPVTVEVVATDDSGVASPKGVVQFELAAQAALQLNAEDLESGNPGKGIQGRLGDGRGKWQLLVGSSAAIEIMSLIRTPDGFLTSLTDVAPKSSLTTTEVYFANPASNQTQQSFLRVVNRTTQSGMVTVTAIDDAGIAAPGGALTFTLGSLESKQINSLDYELGNVEKGLIGALGDGAGKWHLSINSDLGLEVMSMIRTSDGFLTNLSGVTPKESGVGNRVYFVNPASEIDQQTFLRIINTTDQVGSVTLSGVDDAGNIAPGGDLILNLDAFQSVQINSNDLEQGNLDKGLMGSLGDGEGRWTMSISSTLGIEVMSLIRTSDGFVTNLSKATPKLNSTQNDAFIVNPASNVNQRSFLRIVNQSNQDGNVIVSAIDDAGSVAPGGSISFNII
ncbi:MAG: hypothetical protein KUG75_03160, partial [Pseudomonadales bacterium]|nr:hypothetical protein [Pseudomonadales bacterium]